MNFSLTNKLMVSFSTDTLKKIIKNNHNNEIFILSSNGNITSYSLSQSQSSMMIQNVFKINSNDFSIFHNSMNMMISCNDESCVSIWDCRCKNDKEKSNTKKEMENYVNIGELMNIDICGNYYVTNSMENFCIGDIRKNLQIIGKYIAPHGEENVISNVKFYNPGIVFSSGDDGLIQSFDVGKNPDDSLINVYNVENSVDNFWFYDNKSFVCCTHTHELSLWNIDGEKIGTSLNCSCMKSSYYIEVKRIFNKLLCFSGDQQGNIYVSEIGVNNNVTVFKPFSCLLYGHEDIVRTVYVNPQDGVILSGAEDGNCCVWSSKTQVNQRTIPSKIGYTTRVKKDLHPYTKPENVNKN